MPRSECDKANQIAVLPIIEHTHNLGKETNNPQSGVYTYLPRVAQVRLNLIRGLRRAVVEYIACVLLLFHFEIVRHRFRRVRADTQLKTFYQNFDQVWSFRRERSDKKEGSNSNLWTGPPIHAPMHYLRKS